MSLRPFPESESSGFRCSVRGTERPWRASFEFGLSICSPNSGCPLTANTGNLGRVPRTGRYRI